MRYGRIGITRPESFPKLFVIYSLDSAVSAIGRERATNRHVVGEMKCILSAASPDELERYHQMGLTVTHKIIERGTPTAKVNDMVALQKNGGNSRFFRIQAVHNKGEMGIDTVYYCEERGDLQ